MHTWALTNISSPALNFRFICPKELLRQLQSGFHQGDYIDIVLSKVTCDLVLEGIVPSWALALIPQLPLPPVFPETASLEALWSGTWSSVGSVWILMLPLSEWQALWPPMCFLICKMLVVCLHRESDGLSACVSWCWMWCCYPIVQVFPRKMSLSFLLSFQSIFWAI